MKMFVAVVCFLSLTYAPYVSAKKLAPLAKACALRSLAQKFAAMFYVADHSPRYYPNGTMCFEKSLPDNCYFYSTLRNLFLNRSCSDVEEMAVGLLTVAIDSCPNLQSWDGTHTWYSHVRDMRRNLRASPSRQTCKNVELGLGGMFTGVRHKCPSNIMFRTLRQDTTNSTNSTELPNCALFDPYGSHKLQSGILCAICRYVMHAVAGVANIGKNELEYKLMQACVFFGPLKSLCQRFISRRIDFIYDLIMKHLGPDVICHKLKMCTAIQISQLIMRDGWVPRNESNSDWEETEGSGNFVSYTEPGDESDVCKKREVTVRKLPRVAVEQQFSKTYQYWKKFSINERVFPTDSENRSDNNDVAPVFFYNNETGLMDFVRIAKPQINASTDLNFTVGLSQLGEMNMYGRLRQCDGNHTASNICDKAPKLRGRKKRTAILIEREDPDYEGPDGLPLINTEGSWLVFERLFGGCTESIMKWLARYGLIANRMQCPYDVNCRDPNPPGFMSLVKDDQESGLDGFYWRCAPCKSGGHIVKKSIREGSFFSQSNLKLKTILKLSYTWAFYWKMTLGEIKGVIGEDAPADNTITEWYTKFRDICEKWCTDHAPLRRLGGVGKVVEIDESCFFRGKYHRGHWERQQQWVFGMVERMSSNVVVIPVPDRTANALLAKIIEFVHDGSMIMSDMWASYGGLANLPNNYIHQAVNHKYHFVAPGVIPGEAVHTQTIEATWKAIKDSLKHLHGFKNRDLFPTYLFQYMFRRANENKKIWQNMLLWAANFNPVQH